MHKLGLIIGVSLCLKSGEPFLDRVSTGSGSDLVSDQPAKSPNDFDSHGLTRSLPLPVLTRSKRKFLFLVQSLAVLLCMPGVVIGQTSTSCATQSFVLEGRAVRNQEPVGDADVVVVNKSTQQTKTTKTNDAGLFTITGLSCGSYDVTIKLPGLTVVTRTLELQTTVPLTFNLEEAGGIDPPDNTGGGGGEVPLAPAPDTSRPRSGAPSRVRTGSAPASPTNEASTQSFTGDIDCRTWLDSQKALRKRLTRIISVTDGKSIFMLEPIKEASPFNYTVLPIGESIDENSLLSRIKQNSDKTFVGVHRLGPTSYLMVFYGR